MDEKLEQIIKDALVSMGNPVEKVVSVSLYHHQYNYDVVIGILKFALSTTSALPTSIQCKCTPDQKHGETSIMCCNDCGLPCEPFWDVVPSTSLTENKTP